MTERFVRVAGTGYAIAVNGAYIKVVEKDDTIVPRVVVIAKLKANGEQDNGELLKRINSFI